MASASQTSQSEWDVWNPPNADFPRYSVCPISAVSSERGKTWIFKASSPENKLVPIYQVKCDSTKRLVRKIAKAESKSDTSLRRKDFTNYSFYSFNPRVKGRKSSVEAWLYVHEDDVNWLLSNCPAFDPSKAPKTGSKTKKEFQVYEDCSSTSGTGLGPSGDR